MNFEKIPSELFIKNRSKLSAKLPESSCCILFGNDEMPRNGDQCFPYRQSSDLFYLTGIEQEKTILILSPDNPDKNLREVLFILESNPLIETWTGHKLTKEEASAISGINRIEYLDAYQPVLGLVCQTNKRIFLNIPEIPKFVPEITIRQKRLSDEIMSAYPLHNYERLAPLMRDLRSVKEPEEIDSIKYACKITGQAFSRVLKTLRPGMYEKEIEAEISYEFIRNNCLHGYPPIIGSGKNACVLHYTENKDQCMDQDLLLMDFGAEYNNYSADCTRTIPVNGKFTERQALIYDLLHDIFRDAIKMMVPGEIMENVHKEICMRMEKLHLQTGLYNEDHVKNNPAKSPLWFKYYMHGSGHSMGLDVHDIYDKQTPFKPGMVFTCEPGIYIPEEGLGIRIENDILITEDGNIDLMADIPSERNEIEKLMASR